MADIPYTARETIYVDYDTLFVNVDTTNPWDIMSVSKTICTVAPSYRNFKIDFRHTFELHICPKILLNLIYQRQLRSNAVV